MNKKSTYVKREEPLLHDLEEAWGKSDSHQPHRLPHGQISRVVQPQHPTLHDIQQSMNPHLKANHTSNQQTAQVNPTASPQRQTKAHNSIFASRTKNLPSATQPLLVKAKAKQKKQSTDPILNPPHQNKHSPLHITYLTPFHRKQTTIPYGLNPPALQPFFFRFLSFPSSVVSYQITCNFHPFLCSIIAFLRQPPLARDSTLLRLLL
ncbi:hypothetical protein V8C44DRAFT_335674 [Trichoderma aethiopicum]